MKGTMGKAAVVTLEAWGCLWLGPQRAGPQVSGISQNQPGQNLLVTLLQGPNQPPLHTKSAS